MTDSAEIEQEKIQRYAISVLVRAAALIALIGICLQIVAPFIGIVVWAVVLAVALYPLHRSLAGRLGGERRSAILLVLIGLTVLIVPVWLMSESSISAARSLAADLQDGSITIPPPGEKVQSWPIIGPGVYDLWSRAANDIENTINQFQPQLRQAGQQIAGMLGGVAFAVLQFVLSIIIAGAFLLNAEAGYRFARELMSRVSGNRGGYLTDLSVATIRSVTKGVLGVALIQAVASTIGLVVMNVPAAGILGAIVLITAIVQIPTILIMGPVAIWVYSVAEPVPATLFAVFAIVVSLSDNVLKPMLLGRGLEVPMLVILVGAIGGAIAGGLIGLFLGAVVLAIAYEVLRDWLAASTTPAAPASGAEAAT